LFILNVAKTETVRVHRDGSTFKLEATYTAADKAVWDITENCYNRIIHKLEIMS
jgi:hypothetical protein